MSTPQTSLLHAARHAPQTLARLATRTRWTRLLALALLALLGACAPSNCQMTALTTRATCTARTDGDRCPAFDDKGQPMLRVCIKQCKPVVAAGQPCSPDLCAPGGNVCDRNLTCTPTPADPTKSTCERPPGSCDPRLAASATNGCSGGTHCIPIADLPGDKGGHCPAREKLFEGIADTPAGLCVGFVPEGYDCDGSWDEATRLPAPRKICAPCEPGTQCVSGTCRRACDAATPGDSCACDDQCRDGFCRQCAKVGDSCQFPGSTKLGACCDPDAVCNADSKKCCVARTGKCAATGDCCGTDRCSGGRCEACVSAGQGAATADLCCPGLTFRDGKCVAACAPSGQACTVPNAVGQCKEGLTQGCAPDGTPICASTHPQATAEVCDGKDNNCNGKVDDGVPPQSCECGGTRSCNAGQWGSCVRPAGTCTTYSIQCGLGLAYPCSADRDCGPNLFCSGGVCAAAVPLGGCSMPSCWRQSDLSYDRTRCFKAQ